MPAISVIVPVYGVEQYLHRCVDSILAQTYSDFELILVDDGSPDGCPSICNEYAKKDGRVRVIHQKNGGISSARNTGLKRCTGDFIAFIDSDDWVHKEYFSTLMSAQQEKDYDIVICAYTRTKDEDALKKAVSEVNATEISREEYFSSHRTKSYVWGRVYRRSICNRIQFD